MKKQLFEILKLGHYDSSSGIILGIYKLYLTEDPIKIVELLGEKYDADSMKMAKKEFVKIENELNKLKHGG